MDSGLKMETVEEVDTRECMRLTKLKDDIIEVMCNILNYLSVSSYDYHYTQYHENCRKNMNAIYQNGTDSKNALTVESCKHFYECLKGLESVTETDDPDYYTFRRKIRRLIISLASITSSPSS
jgi:hypothetical protein